MKKYLSFFMILILIILSSITFVGCKEDKFYQAYIESDDIALLTLFSFNGNNETKYGIKNLGHSWISIKNISDNDININNYNIETNELLVIGSWSIAEHFGIWYNVESNYTSIYNKYNGRVSITIGINENDIKLINEFIINNDRWNIIFNCSKFALSLYNTVASDNEYINKPFICSPSYLSREIKKFNEYEYNKKFQTSENIGYFKDNKFISFKMEGYKNENI